MPLSQVTLTQFPWKEPPQGTGAPGQVLGQQDRRVGRCLSSRGAIGSLSQSLPLLASSERIAFHFCRIIIFKEALVIKKQICVSLEYTVLEKHRQSLPPGARFLRLHWNHGLLGTSKDISVSLCVCFNEFYLQK